MIRVLVAGESWITTTTHTKGFDHFTSSAFETGVGDFKRALEDMGMRVTHMPGHEVAEEFPWTIEELNQFDVVVLSDIGANTFLLSRRTWVDGVAVPNRLAVLADWVRSGGGLMMAGGYMSFQGIDGRARFHGTDVEAVLPVQIHAADDRVEVPEGVVGVVRQSHAVVDSVRDLEWPPLLGYNRTIARPDSEVIVSAGDDPLLAVRSVGQGRSLVWTSDIAPHWCPRGFTEWDGYAEIMKNSVAWLADT
ncbi:glutamine amidotransferase [Microbacterium soli]|uniref:Glutamine amidotransferase n=1 Tax=Microbacterium soli TaxID=446075 RepID=A0ABP7N614_9MICO